MSVPPPSAKRGAGFPDWLPSARKATLIAAAAFAIGLFLFLLLWLQQRGRNDHSGLDTATPSTQGDQMQPLPIPLPADRTGASGLEPLPQTPQQIQQPRTTQAPPTPAAPALPSTQVPAPAPSTAIDTAPQAVDSPPPHYPRSAQRRGETGTVLLRVHVSAAGDVIAVDLIQSSHSRDLDRAASDAVRRWRFRPAMREGRAAAASVQVPITFRLPTLIRT